ERLAVQVDQLDLVLGRRECRNRQEPEWGHERLLAREFHRVLHAPVGREELRIDHQKPPDFLHRRLLIQTDDAGSSGARSSTRARGSNPGYDKAAPADSGGAWDSRLSTSYPAVRYGEFLATVGQPGARQSRSLGFSSDDQRVSPLRERTRIAPRQISLHFFFRNA